MFFVFVAVPVFTIMHISYDYFGADEDSDVECIFGFYDDQRQSQLL